VRTNGRKVQNRAREKAKKKEDLPQKSFHDLRRSPVRRSGREIAMQSVKGQKASRIFTAPSLIPQSESVTKQTLRVGIIGSGREPSASDPGEDHAVGSA